MAQEIKPCKQVQATLTLPGSKSYTHRALMAAALAAGESVLTNALTAEDTELTAQALAQLGAGIDWQGTDHPGDGPERPLAAGVTADLPGQLRHLHALPHRARGPGRRGVPPHRHRAPLPAAPGGVAHGPGRDRGPGGLGKRRRLPAGQGHRRPHRRPGAAFRLHQQPVPVGPDVHRAPGARRPQDRHHRRVGVPALRGPDPGGAGRLRHLLLPGRLPLF